MTSHVPSISSRFVAACAAALLAGCSREAAPKQSPPDESAKKLVINDLKELDDLKLKFKFKENKESPLKDGKKTESVVK